MSNLIQFPEPVKGKDIKLVIGEGSFANIKEALMKRAKMLGKVRSYEFKGASNYYLSGRGNFVDPVYDLAELSRVIDIEPFIAQSVRKHREQILKEGYLISGKDKEMVDYIHQRLFEISLLTQISTEQWLRDLVHNLVLFHNAFLVVKRDAERSGGTHYKMFGKRVEPIAGIFVGDPTTMQVKVDKYGTVKKWNQKLINDYGTTIDREFFPEDVIHLTLDKKSGYTFGTPYILPVLDDIRALRKLEELAITVVSKEAFPLVHYKVGTDDRPAILYEDGQGSEVDNVMSQVAALPSHGYVVTSERHSIELIAKQGSIIDMAPYIEYFESRVLAGLRLSPLDLGRGGTSNRATAGNINQNLETAAKDYQKTISDILTFQLILPLLLEGGFDVTPDNLVIFTFPTINKEEERAHQNHGLQLYMGNAITCTEYREAYLNMPPLSEEQKSDLNIELQTKAQIDIVKSKPISTSPSSSSSNSAVRNQVTNKAKPANQHGSTPKSRFTANDYRSNITQYLYELKSELLTLRDLDPDAVETTIDSKLHNLVNKLLEASSEEILQCVKDGVEKAELDYENLNPDADFIKQDIGRRSLDRFFNNFISKSLWRVVNPYRQSLYDLYKKDSDGNSYQERAIIVVEELRKQLIDLSQIQTITSQRFGYIKFAKRMGYKYIDIINQDTLESQKIDISNIIYKTFMPQDLKDTSIVSFPKEIINNDTESND